VYIRSDGYCTPGNLEKRVSRDTTVALYFCATLRIFPHKKKKVQNLVFICVFTRDGNPWSWIVPLLDSCLANCVLLVGIFAFVTSKSNDWTTIAFCLALCHLGTTLLLVMTQGPVSFCTPNKLLILTQSSTTTGNVTTTTTTAMETSATSGDSCLSAYWEHYFITLSKALLIGGDIAILVFYFHYWKGPTHSADGTIILIVILTMLGIYSFVPMYFVLRAIWRCFARWNPSRAYIITHASKLGPNQAGLFPGLLITVGILLFVLDRYAPSTGLTIAGAVVISSGMLLATVSVWWLWTPWAIDCTYCATCAGTSFCIALGGLLIFLSTGINQGTIEPTTPTGAMIAWLIIGILFVVCGSGCLVTATLKQGGQPWFPKTRIIPPGTVVESATSGGAQRETIVHIPSNATFKLFNEHTPLLKAKDVQVVAVQPSPLSDVAPTAIAVAQTRKTALDSDDEESQPPLPPPDRMHSLEKTKEQNLWGSDGESGQA